MKAIRKIPVILFLLCCRHVFAQITFPVNGPHNQLPRFDVFIHATIVTDYQTVLQDATMIVKNGKIEQVGNNLPIPAGALVHHMNGRWIYPAFIDLYSNYGVKTDQEKKQGKTQGFISSKNGAYHWNEAIRPEFHSGDFFSYDDKKASQLRASGFGVTLSSSLDGIYRGTAALVLTGNLKDHELLLRDKAAVFLSFNKGSSTQDYPSSLMGSIALLRQTYYDAKWYKTQQTEKNLSTEAFLTQQLLPQIFAVDNKLNMLRADKIADEFGIRYIIKGNGDEYQRVEEIKATGSPLIIPLKFPKPYDISDPFDADLISTADLKHWEMAPANIAMLAKQNLEFCITSFGCNNADEFISNMRKSVLYGANQQDILKALTVTPARLIKAEQQLGSLKPGMMANFFISTGNIFDKDATIQSLWTNGYKNEVQEGISRKLSGKYRLKGTIFNNAVISIVNRNHKTEAQLITETDTMQSGIEVEEFVLLNFKEKKESEKRYAVTAIITQTDSAVYPHNILSFTATVRSADGKTDMFQGNWFEDNKETDKAKDSVPRVVFGELVFPFTDYGNPQQPVQETIIFRNATVWTNEAEGIVNETDVAIKAGKIVAVGKGLKIEGAKEIDATGKHLTTGIIDEHSHIAISNGVNEGTQAITSEVRIGDVVNSEDINIYRQLAGGVTSSQLLHGSANPIGGQSALIKLRWGLAPEKMKIEGADGFIKFALGENVKQSNWGERSTFRYPQTRMGVEQMMRDGFTRAREYQLQVKTDPASRKDLELEALAEILAGKRFITCHSYVQSEINMLMHLADSFNFKVNTFTHILEGYKVADKMKKHGVNASTFADWWAYKYEVIDAIPYNAAILSKMGVNTAINSDDAEMGRRLNQEAAKIVKYGGVSEEEAWKMVTLNPAKMLHLQNRLGSVKPGKDADLVLWDNNPLSIYAKPVYTFVDGRCYYSLEQDKQLREKIQAERQRIIKKLLEAKAKGEKAEKHVSAEDPDYHCED